MKTRLFFLIITLLASPLSSQNFQWAKRAGLWAFDLGYGVGTDNAGNVYIAGKYEMNANFGGTTVGCAGNHDIFVAKYSPSGSFLWVRTSGGSGGDYAHALAVDAAGNVYVTGEFEGTSTFAPGVTLKSNGDNDIFISKYNTNGVLQWVRKLGGGKYSDKGLGISLSGNGGVYITGKFEGTGNFAGVTLSSAGGKEMFLAKYTTSGVFQWAKRAGGSGSDEGAAVSNDPAGNVYVTGWFTGTANFSGTTLTAKGGKDAFIAKYNSSGSLLWVKKMGGSYDDFGRGIKVDDAYRVFVTGEFRSKMTIGSTNLTSSGGSDIYTARFDASGNLVWANKSGGSSNDAGRALALDAGSNVFITGHYGYSAKFGSNTISGADAHEMFFASFTNTGNFRWVSKATGVSDGSYSGDLHEMGLGIATDRWGNVVATGAYRKSSSFGNTQLSAWTNTDIFVTKLSQSTSLARRAAPGIVPADSGSFCAGGFVMLETLNDSISVYKWMRNGQVIDNVTGTSCKATVPGNYNVLIIQGDDSLMSATTKIVETKKITSSILVPQKTFCRDSVNRLTATSGDGYYYQWKRNGLSLRGANSATLAVTREGNYQVKIIQGSCFDWSPATKVSFEKCAAADSTEEEEITDVNSVQGDDSTLVIKVYPNPNSGLFTLELNMAKTIENSQGVNITVINSLGQILYEKSVTEMRNDITEEINIDSSAETGIYFLRVSMGDIVETNKIMLLR